MIAKFFRSRSEQTTNVILVKYPNSGFADNALKGLGEYLALLPFVVLVVMFILLPLGLIIFNAFYNEYGEFGFGNFSKIFNSEFYLQALVLSLKISLYSSLIGIIIGFQGAYSLYAIKDSALGRALISLNTLLSNFSGVPLAFAMMIIFGSSGVITLILSRFGINDLIDIYSFKGILLS
ncbi:polyamine ABC transporter permease, partial [Moraxella catarrhalis]|nr:polyamine ABC transporter permease [Moraxella catarrhalis]